MQQKIVSISKFYASKDQFVCQSDYYATLNQLCEKVTLLSDQLQAYKQENAHLRFQLHLLDAGTTNGKFLWDIDNVLDRRNDALLGKTESIISPIFLTSEQGYQFSLLAFLNGDGDYKGKCVSLYLMVMRGKHDALLHWPINCLVTLYVLHETDHNKNIIFRYESQPGLPSFQRPISDSNRGSGKPDMIPVSYLQEPSLGFVHSDKSLRIFADVKLRGKSSWLVI